MGRRGEKDVQEVGGGGRLGGAPRLGAPLLSHPGGGKTSHKKKLRQDSSIERKFFGGFFWHPLYKNVAPKRLPQNDHSSTYIHCKKSCRALYCCTALHIWSVLKHGRG